MKWLRNKLIPKTAFHVVMYREDTGDITRLFLDEKTMNRWIYYLQCYGYQQKGSIMSIPIVVNHKGF
jgi:hypothetical protein